MSTMDLRGTGRSIPLHCELDQPTTSQHQFEGNKVTTEDCQASYDEMKARGVEFTEEPHEMPYGIDCGFRDPSGNSVRLTQLADIPANTG